LSALRVSASSVLNAARIRKIYPQMQGGGFVYSFNPLSAQNTPLPLFKTPCCYHLTLTQGFRWMPPASARSVRFHPTQTSTFSVKS